MIFQSRYKIPAIYLVVDGKPVKVNPKKKQFQPKVDGPGKNKNIHLDQDTLINGLFFPAGYYAFDLPVANYTDKNGEPVGVEISIPAEDLDDAEQISDGAENKGDPLGSLGDTVPDVAAAIAADSDGRGQG